MDGKVPTPGHVSQEPSPAGLPTSRKERAKGSPPASALGGLMPRQQLRRFHSSQLCSEQPFENSDGAGRVSETMMGLLVSSSAKEGEVVLK